MQKTMEDENIGPYIMSLFIKYKEVPSWLGSRRGTFLDLRGSRLAKTFMREKDLKWKMPLFRIKSGGEGAWLRFGSKNQENLY